MELSVIICTLLIMSAPDIHTISLRVFSLLESLSPNLFYHCPAHTEDVVRQAERIALEEGVHGHELFILKVAALYHDTGFLDTYFRHEEKSCAIFLEDNRSYKLPKKDVELIIGLIMATRVPQLPNTLLQRILCDADLDYLGRKDYDEIAELLRKEFLHYGIVANEHAWMELQRKFLSTHHYHTASSQRLREPVKQKNLKKIL